ncbi:hypothetical protein Btru_020977 [Bulinus truncatus]|nr:hypothetical protein Btru_020977 [Bulinus truncatus]
MCQWGIRDYKARNDFYTNGSKYDGLKIRTRLKKTAKPVKLLSKNQEPVVSDCEPICSSIQIMSQPMDVEHSYATDIQPETPREILDPGAKKACGPIYGAFHNYCKNSSVFDLKSQLEHPEAHGNGPAALPSLQGCVRPSLQMLDTQPSVNEFICSSLQIMDIQEAYIQPIVSECQPINSSIQMTDVQPVIYECFSLQKMHKQIENDHNYATDITTLRQKYEESITSLQTKTKEVLKLKRQRAHSSRKILNLTKELKDTKKLYDEAYSRLRSYKGIPVELFKKPVKEYSSEQINFASTLYCFGGKLYEFLRGKIHLPHPSSIRRLRQSTPKQSTLKSSVTRQFKSPLNRSETEAGACSESQLQEQIEALKKTLQNKESEIQELTSAGYKESELQEHIDKLHEYNEIKDIGQMLMGRIAEIEGLQTKDLYERYGLDLNA